MKVRMSYAMIPYGMHVPGTIPQHAIYAPHPAMQSTGTANAGDSCMRLMCVLDMIAHSADPELCARAQVLCCKFLQRCGMQAEEAWGGHVGKVQAGGAGTGENNICERLDKEFFQENLQTDFFQELKTVLENDADAPPYVQEYMNENLPEKRNCKETSPTSVLLNFVSTEKAFVVVRDENQDLLYFAPKHFDSEPTTYAIVKWNGQTKKFENHYYVKFYDDFEKIQKGSNYNIYKKSYNDFEKAVFLQEFMHRLEQKFTEKKDEKKLDMSFHFLKKSLAIFDLDAIKKTTDEELWFYINFTGKSEEEKINAFCDHIFKRQFEDLQI